MRTSVFTFLKALLLLLSVQTLSYDNLKAQCSPPIINGEFNAGLTGWINNTPAALTTKVDTYSVSGSPAYRLLVGKISQNYVPATGQAQIYQVLNIPARGGRVSFDYETFMSANSTGSSQLAYIADSNGVPLDTIVFSTGTTALTPVSYDLIPFAGRKVRLVFETNLYSTQSYFKNDNRLYVYHVSTALSFAQQIDHCISPFADHVVNSIYTQGGIFRDTLASSVSGCDSMVITKITYHPVRFSQTVLFCENYPISFQVGPYTHTAIGLYSDTFRMGAASGCDSVVQTTIAFRDPAIQTLVYAICDSGTVAPIGIPHHATSTTVFYDTLFGAAMYGCDSILKLIVNVSPTPRAVPQVSSFTLCNGDSSQINFTVPDSSWSFAKWRSSNSTIGLNAMGLNGLPKFAAINNTNKPIIDTITVITKGKGYAWNASNNKIYKYDLSDPIHLIDSCIVPGGHRVQNFVFSPDGNIIYATELRQSSSHRRVVYSFSTATCDLIRTYNMTTTSASGDEANSNICISPDGTYLYILHSPWQSYFDLFKLNTVTGTYITLTRTPADSFYTSQGVSLAITKDGSKLYASLFDAIDEFDATNLSLIRRIKPTNANYVKMALSPDEKQLIVGRGRYGARIHVIDIASGAIVDTLNTDSILNIYGDHMGGFMYNPDSTILYVHRGFTEFNYNNGTATGTMIYAFNPRTYEPIFRTGRYITMGNVPGLNIGPTGGGSPYLSNFCVTPDGKGYITTNYALYQLFSVSPMAPFPNSGVGYVESYMSRYTGPEYGTIGNLVEAGHCESPIMRFTITIFPTARDTQSRTICQGQSYTVTNKAYTATGVYSDTLKGASRYGCDSIITTRLYVIPRAKTYQAFNFCAGGSVRVGNILHSVTGYYSDTLTGSNSCDSIVFTNLTIAPPVTVPTVTVNNQSVCANGTVPATVLGTGSSGNSIVWNGSTTAIGLAASGTGTVPAFTALNNTNVTLIDTIAVTATESGFAYVSNPNYDKVTVINRQTNTVVTDITGISGAAGIAVDRSGSRIYVAGQNTNKVNVINAATNSVLRTITVGTQPFNVAVNPAGTKVYTANYSSGNVSVIDTVTNTVTATITVGGNPRGIVVHPDSKRVFVCNSGSGTVSDINALTNTVTATIPVGNTPYGVAINPTGTRVYVANLISGSVSVIDATADTLITTVTIGSTPRGIAVTPDGAKVYVADFLGDKVYVINTATNTVLTSVTVSSRPTGVSISADGTRAYVTCLVGGAVSVISTATNTVVGSVTGLPGPDCVGNFTSGSGCSSTPVKYTIAVNPTARRTQQINLCSGSSITIGSHIYNSAGTFIDTFHNASMYGCDSILTTQISLISPVTTSITTSICAGGNYAGHTTAGTYTDHYTGVLGCDSARTLNLTIKPNVTSTITTAICQGANYAGHTTAGTFVDHYTSASGCDSARTLILTIKPNVTATITTAICQGANYAGHSTAGTFVDHYTSASGCDSARTLILTIKPNVTATITTAICQGANYAGHTTTGTFVDHYTSASGCDSARTLNLTVNPNVTSTITTAICQGANYAGHNTTGTFVDHYTSASGCDSARTLILTIKPNIGSVITISICQGANYAGHTTTGTFIDHYTSASGCDSARTLNLTVKPNVTSTINVAICQGANYAGHSTTGTFVDHYTGASGCDSARTLNLTIKPNVTAIITTAICQGANYAGHTTSGTFVDHYTSASGCDSARTLNLTVNPNVTATITEVICQGSSYAGHSTAGTFVDHYTSATGCDSARTLQLTIAANLTTAVSETICAGNSYAGHDTSGIFVDHFTAAGGCDSMRTLTLTVLPNISTTINQTICEGAAYAGHSTSGTYVDHYTGVQGCDSMRTLHLSVNPITTSDTTISICGAQLPYVWNGLTFTTEGSKTATGFINASGCDSTATLHLQVISINDTATAEGAICRAHQTGASYQWINCTTNEIVIGADSASFTASENGSYQCVIALGNCADTTNCVNVTTIGIHESDAFGIAVQPNPTTGRFSVLQTGTETLEIKLSDRIGRVVKEMVMTTAVLQIDIRDLPAGMYQVTVSKDRHLQKVVKLIKE
ncbi:MAG: beta-propeller fold lactonase family protein [Chitinophagales bacterium]